MDGCSAGECMCLGFDHVQGRNIQLLASGCWLNAIAFIGKIQKAKGVAASVKTCV